MIRLRLPMAPLFAAVVCAACAPSSLTMEAASGVSVEILYRGNDCGRQASDPHLTWIADQPRLSQFQQQMGRDYLPPQVITFPVVDFSREGVLVIEMGRRPSAGYGVDLASSPGKFRNATLWLSLFWREPAPGSMQAQVLTSPCVIVRIPKGTFRSIQLVDQAGLPRGKVSLDE